MKQQMNIRVSKATREKIDYLTNNLYGTQAETIAVAVDRLYQASKAQYLLSKGGNKMNCSICGKPITEAQIANGDAIKTAHTDCIDDLSRREDDAYHQDANEE